MLRRRDVRRLLRRWARTDEQIAALEGQLKAIADEIDALGDLHAQKLDGMPHSPAVGRPTEAAALRRIDLSERYHDRLAEINRKIEALERFRDHIEKALLFTSPDEEYVIRMAYAGHLEAEKKERAPMPFSQIAEVLQITERRVRQLETAAVVEIMTQLNQEDTWKKSKF